MTPEAFKATRLRLHMSRAKFAAALGISPNAATSYEHGRTRIPRYIGLAVAAILHGLPPAQ